MVPVLRKIVKNIIQVLETKQDRLMFLSSCAICGKKNRLSLKIKNSILIIFEMIS